MSEDFDMGGGGEEVFTDSAVDGSGAVEDSNVKEGNEKQLADQGASGHIAGTLNADAAENDKAKRKRIKNGQASDFYNSMAMEQAYKSLKKSVKAMQQQVMRMSAQMAQISEKASQALGKLESDRAMMSELLKTQKSELDQLEQDLVDKNYYGGSEESHLVQMDLKQAEIDNTQTIHDLYVQTIDTTTQTLNTANDKINSLNTHLSDLEQRIDMAQSSGNAAAQLEALQAERDAVQVEIQEAQLSIDIAERHAEFAVKIQPLATNLQDASNQGGSGIEYETAQISRIEARTAIAKALIDMTKDASIDQQEFEILKDLSVKAGISTNELYALAQDIGETGIAVIAADGTIYSGADANDYVVRELEEQIAQSQSDLNQLVTDLQNSGQTEEAQIVQDVVEMKDYIVVDYKGEQHIVYRDENDSSHIYVVDTETGDRVYVNQMEEPDRTNAFTEFNVNQKGQKTGDQDPADAVKKDAAIVKLHANPALSKAFQDADNNQYAAQQKLADVKENADPTTSTSTPQQTTSETFNDVSNPDSVQPTADNTPQVFGGTGITPQPITETTLDNIDPYLKITGTQIPTGRQGMFVNSSAFSTDQSATYTKAAQSLPEMSLTETYALANKKASTGTNTDPDKPTIILATQNEPTSMTGQI